MQVPPVAKPLPSPMSGSPCSDAPPPPEPQAKPRAEIDIGYIQGAVFVDLLDPNFHFLLVRLLGPGAGTPNPPRPLDAKIDPPE